jgi:gluconate 5-dehydrogenase
MNVSELFSLKGRVALITGGSRGLGLQIAEALGEVGARVVLTARKQAELDQAQAHLRERGIDAVTFACDLQDLQVAQALPGKVLERCQRLDILVNNAGATWGASAETHPLEAWHKVINLNLNAVFALTQAAAQQAMIPAQRGRIISIASIAGLRGTDPSFMATVAYNTSKGGIVNFTRQIACRVGALRNHFNSNSPFYNPPPNSLSSLLPFPLPTSLPSFPQLPFIITPFHA